MIRMIVNGSLLHGKTVKTSMLTLTFDFERKYKIEDRRIWINRWSGFLYMGEIEQRRYDQLMRDIKSAELGIGDGTFVFA